MNTFGSALALYGRIEAVIGGVVGFIIGIILIVVGYFMLKDSASTAGTITSVQCHPDQHGNNYDCTANVQITVDGRTYISPLVETRQKPFYNGESVLVHYDPDNPSDMTIGTGDNKLWSYGFIGVGVLLVIVMPLIAYFSIKSKTFAMVEGAADVIGDAETIF